MQEKNMTKQEALEAMEQGQPIIQKYQKENEELKLKINK